MGMPEALRRWTREEVLALPDDGMRHELFDGELIVSPAPRYRHQDVLFRLLLLVGNYCRDVKLGKVLLSPADLPLLGGQVAQPDLFVLPHGDFAQDWSDAPVPILAIEVASPSTVRYDRGLKRRGYQKACVNEYWIVDPEARLVERWRPQDTRPEVLLDNITWQPEAAVAPLTIELATLFGE
jgi:Uma2 family endonuclease